MSGRRAAGRATECSLWLPAGSGAVSGWRTTAEEGGRPGPGDGPGGGLEQRGSEEGGEEGWNDWSSSGVRAFSKRGRVGKRPGASREWWTGPPSCAPGPIPSASGCALCPPAGRRGSSAGRKRWCPAWSRRQATRPRRGGRRALRRRAGRAGGADRSGGRDRDFLAPFSVATLGRPDLAVTLQRLGITTLGQLAALPAANISDRFGADAAVCHAVARGETASCPACATGASPATASGPGEDPDRDAAPVPHHRSSPASSAARPRRTSGRPVPSFGCRSAWGSTPCWWGGSRVGATRRVSRCCCPGAALRWRGAIGGAPWPGRLPPPAPSDVLREPPRAELVDAGRQRHGGERSGPAPGAVDRLSVNGGPWQEVVGWAGPWPVTERWWEVRRRRARLQVVTADGVARLLCNERGRWWGGGGL